MTSRAKSKFRKPGLTLKTRSDGVILGLTLSYLFWGSLLLTRCGDVELNPGPLHPPSKSTGPSRSLRQQTINTRQLTPSPGSSGSQPPPSPLQHDKEPSLKDVMSRLDKLDTLDRKFDQLADDFRGLRDSCLALQNEVKDLKDDCASLREENSALKAKNCELEKRVEKVEKKADDLECRSKRNNIIIHGLRRPDGETPTELETTVRELFTDKLELAESVPFERLHRLNGKPNAPVIGCCSSFRDKVEIMRAKGKLRGTDIFIGEDFSQRVRDLRRRLTPHLKKARSEGKRATMIFDHLLVDGKKYSVDDSDNLLELR